MGPTLLSLRRPEGRLAVPTVLKSLQPESLDHNVGALKNVTLRLQKLLSRHRRQTQQEKVNLPSEGRSNLCDAPPEGRR